MRSLPHVSIHRSITKRHRRIFAAQDEAQRTTEGMISLATAQSPLSVALSHEQGKSKKWTVRCKIHSKRPEEDAETKVMKAQESNGQQKQLFEFNI
jgi:hypothetical protein